MTPATLRAGVEQNNLNKGETVSIDPVGPTESHLRERGHRGPLKCFSRVPVGALTSVRVGARFWVWVTGMGDSERLV